MDIRDIHRVVIAGGGVMGSSMAQAFAQAGFAVAVYDVVQSGLDKAAAMADLNQQSLVATGAITSQQSRETLGRLAYTTDMDCFAGCPLVVESIVEKLEVKSDFYKKVSRRVPEGALLASNTSALPITELSKSVWLPHRFAGMHWFNPPHIIPLVEVIKGEETDEETVDCIFALAEKIGKKPVRILKDAKGFAANRLQFALLREALHIVDSGIASAEDVDKIVKYALGFRYACLGPFEIADFGGLDTFAYISSFLNPDLCSSPQVSPTLAAMAEEGKHGVKSGQGFYDYSQGKDRQAIKNRDQLYLALYKLLQNP